MFSSQSKISPFAHVGKIFISSVIWSLDDSVNRKSPSPNYRKCFVEDDRIHLIASWSCTITHVCTDQYGMSIPLPGSGSQSNPFRVQVLSLSIRGSKFKHTKHTSLFFQKPEYNAYSLSKISLERGVLRI